MKGIDRRADWSTHRSASNLPDKSIKLSLHLRVELHGLPLNPESQKREGCYQAISEISPSQHPLQLCQPCKDLCQSLGLRVRHPPGYRRSETVVDMCSLSLCRTCLPPSMSPFLVMLMATSKTLCHANQRMLVAKSMWWTKCSKKI